MAGPAITGASFAPVSAAADPIIVFAAASTANAIVEMQQSFEAATGHDVVLWLALKFAHA